MSRPEGGLSLTEFVARDELALGGEIDAVEAREAEGRAGHANCTIAGAEPRGAFQGVRMVLHADDGVVHDADALFLMRLLTGLIFKAREVENGLRGLVKVRPSYGYGSCSAPWAAEAWE